MGIREYIDNAIKSKKSVTIKYIKYAGEYSERKISNIQYSDEFGPDYIQAFCHKRQENRTFKICRILSVDGVTVVPSTPSTDIKVKKTAYTGNSTSSSRLVVDNKPSVENQTKTTVYSPLNHTPSYPSHLSEQTSFQSSASTTKKTEGCYIATMAYGDYDHPHVVVLRKYRDNVLLKTVFGQLFVKFYYWFSPKLVHILQGHERINAFICKLLGKIVERIK